MIYPDNTPGCVGWFAACDCASSEYVRTSRAGMTHRIVFVLAFGIACLIGAGSTSARPRLPHLFSEHRVLQRGRELAVWGRADAGERIVVMLRGIGTCGAEWRPAPGLRTRGRLSPCRADEWPGPTVYER